MHVVSRCQHHNPHKIQQIPEEEENIHMPSTIYDIQQFACNALLVLLFSIQIPLHYIIFQLQNTPNKEITLV
jgi:hypothetical protein